MIVTLTIKNYRCFASPATIDLGRGFTAFVGVNNAGKSALMRFLLEMRPLLNVLGNTEQQMGLRHINIYGFAPMAVTDPQEIFSNRNSNALEFWLDFRGDDGGYVAGKPTRVLLNIDRTLHWRSEIHLGDGTVIPRETPGNIQIHNNLVYEDNNRVVADLTEFARWMNILGRTLYVGPFRNAINVGTTTDYFDIQIGESFIKSFRSLKTGSIKQDSTNIQTLTDNIRRIFEFDTLDIIPSADDMSLHITVNGRPYKQHELGSGLAQFIVVLANASIKRPKLILIDEPELNLHPRLQLDFLTTLGSYSDEGVWFSTHSIGLARAAAERAYSVLRRGDGDSIVRRLEGTPRLTEFLGEMSFSAHQELGFDKILLVEGPTEVKVIQQFLRGMGKEHKILLLPLHGHLPQADEIDELRRITTNIAGLIDSERVSAISPLENKRQEFVDVCRSRDIKVHVLERRALENYFPDSTVKRVFGDQYLGLGPYERLNGSPPHWGKSQNWKLASSMSLDEIRQTDLGQFLQSI